MSQEKKKYASELRDRAKKAVQKIRASYFEQPEEELTAALEQAAPAVREVLRLAEEFSEDIEGYCDGKDAFVKQLEQTALRFARFPEDN